MSAMWPYTTDFLKRNATAADEGNGSERVVSRLSGVSQPSDCRLPERRRGNGSRSPRPHESGLGPVLGAHRQQLAGLPREHIDEVLGQLSQRDGCFRSLGMIWRVPRNCGLTSERDNPHADERDRPGVREERRSFLRRTKPVEPNRQVFADDAGVATAYGAASLGPQAVGAVTDSWKPMTVVSALRLYVEQGPGPELRRCIVVSSREHFYPHQAPGVNPAVGWAVARLLSLSPYSPDHARSRQRGQASRRPGSGYGAVHLRPVTGARRSAVEGDADDRSIDPRVAPIVDSCTARG
jgi:hypothetical protein